MTLIIIVTTGLIGVSLLSLYSVYFVITLQVQYNHTEFIEKHPQFAWLEYDYLIEIIVDVLLIAGIFVTISFLQTAFCLGLVSLIFASIALFNGIITIKTGVCRIPRPKMPYIYIFDPNLIWFGKFKVIVAAAVMILAIVLSQYRGPL